MNGTSEQATVSELRYLKGVGPKKVQVFEKIGIVSIRELLYLFPRRYEDRSCFFPVAEVRPGEVVTIRGEILSAALKRMRALTLLDVLIGDKSGAIHAVWFNQPYLKKQMEAGREVIFYGKAEIYQGKLQMMSPEYEFIDADLDPVHTSRITPVYPLTEGLFQRSLRMTLYDVVHRHLTRHVRETYPETFRRRLDLIGLPEAIAGMHFPESFEQQAAARKRVVFDEFFIFELLLLRKMEVLRTQYRSYAIEGARKTAEEFASGLPFELTGDQRKSIGEIARDMERDVPMNRLLHGDVGSGKTVVGAFALLAAAKQGLQGVCLVPTEILAEQHFRTFQAILSPHNIAVGLLTSSTAEDRRKRMLAELKNGKLPLIVGTHALLQEDVAFSSLAVVLIDEQHKFGVRQRCQLLNRPIRPHQLVMTATPIPRTLALTVYGDLDVSSIRELPAGRQTISTYWITRQKQPDVLRHIFEKIAQGEQAYFIYPLIDETEKSDLRAAQEGYEQLKKGIFSRVKIGLVHGRLDSGEREAVMKAFARGEIKALVATSVIEVGVDNPNATVMVIENAERFGLSQLHQMRGRIGRGSKASECFLFGEPKTVEGQKRLRIMTKTRDGFVIAEEDLKLRGPGEFLGTKQSGTPLFKYADPLADQESLLVARDMAAECLREKWLTDRTEWEVFRRHLEDCKIQY